ncbi:MAG: 5'-nucleotidase C-terminal domain-containing protein [Tissierellales bacterium]|jgi:2',3'-cyclic-nucleotide 2'-phosphodiesterase/3'-nucleotidase|nr:5'-nucleotidase C-terminal domain-containing protein [Tissierellales bacterium]
MQKKSLKAIAIMLVCTLFVMVPMASVFAANSEEKTVTILQTSDLHGRIYAYNYATDSVDSDAGLAKIKTLVDQERAKDPKALLIDCGDTIQDNSASLFHDLPVHPMIEVLNEMKYDVWTLGNHEFNFGLDIVEKNIKGFNGTVLASNIYKEGTEERFVDGYKIFDVDGVKVAVVGMIPPYVPVWEASTPSHFKGLEFKPVLEETKKVIKELEGKYDVLVGAYHVGPEGEHGYEGVREVANACPEFDAILAGHAHSAINEEVNGVRIVEPKKYGWALAKVQIKLNKENDKWTVKEVTGENLETKPVDEDATILEEFKSVHDKSIADANEVVGKITADFIQRPDYITGEDKITTMPTAQLEDTSVIDLINEVQMYYSKADVSSAALFNFGSNLKAGDFKKKDVAYIYKYDNTLMGVNITGENLIKYMEWSASYYNAAKDGDVTISFNPKVRGYNYDMFSGVSYDIDLSQEVGNRIKNVKVAGKELDPKKVYKLAVNNYRYGTLQGLELIKAEDKYYDAYDEFQDGGRIRELIVRYTKEVKKGTLNPTVDNNWKIIGVSLDSPYKEVIFNLVKEGKLAIPTSEDGRTKNVKALNVNELLKEGVISENTTSTKEEVKAPVVSEKENTPATKEEVKVPAKEIVKATDTQIYVVKSGDVLWKIAEKFGMKWEDLASSNNLKNPNVINVGQKLVIPAK